MSLKKSHLPLITLLAWTIGYTQTPLQKPGFPMGSTATQEKAIPFYNEACELYEKGNIDEAVTSLEEAISTSFAFVEAHLFLADIMVQKNEYERAMVYYNSGIDFAIRQKPHYYFNLFDLAMRFGEYGVVKQNLKHFKKIHGKLPSGAYEENYPFVVKDYEYYQACMKLVYNWESWRSKYSCSHLSGIEADQLFEENGNLGVRTRGYKRLKFKKNGRLKTKKSALGNEDNMEHPFISADGKFLIYSKEVDGQYDLYFRKKAGKKWGDEMTFPAEINSQGFEGYPYLTKDGKFLFYSSSKNGNKDLFVAEVNLAENKVLGTKSLDRVNGPHDEIAPTYDEEEKVFYFASNSHAGFGGFDIFYCIDSETMNGFTTPMVPRNMKSPVNSHQDEIKIEWLDSETAFLLRKDIYEKSSLFRIGVGPEIKRVDIELYNGPYSEKE